VTSARWCSHADAERADLDAGGISTSADHVPWKFMPTARSSVLQSLPSDTLRRNHPPAMPLNLALLPGIFSALRKAGKLFQALLRASSPKA
jgi:hypothetical protein